MASLVYFGAPPPTAFSQYYQPPQAYTGGYTAYPAQNQNTSGPMAGAGQLANQSDHELLAAARLFQQQGRAAQAQKIYQELQRRSLSRLQGHGPGNYSTTPAQAYQPFTPISTNATPAWNPGAAPSSNTGWIPVSHASTNDGANSAAQSIQPGRAITVPAGTDSLSTPATSGAASGASSQQTSVMVLDRQVTPATASVEQTTSGWRPAITPLPAALSPVPPPANRVLEQSAAVVAGPPLELTSQIDPSLSLDPAQPGTAPASSERNVNLPIAPAHVADANPISPTHPLELARQAAADMSAELPNIPAVPLPAMAPERPSGMKSVGVPPVAQEPAAFAPPTGPGQRALPVAGPLEVANVVDEPGSAPPVRHLTPQAVPQTVPLANEADLSSFALESAAKLAKQTDDIRIIPGHRGSAHSRLEAAADGTPSKEKQPPDPTEAAADPLIAGWKSYTAMAAPASADSESRVNVTAPRGDSLESTQTTTEPHQAQVRQPMPVDAERSVDPKPVFDLATLIKDPEFREIHTRPVLDGLELLAQPESRHRLLGAMRIGVVGPDARTALPALRQLLSTEANTAVRLRIAEAILRLLPNDRAALDALSRLLVEPNDAELRQAAAGALGSAAGSGNATAIVRLIDALDDPVPPVRIMAALSLAQFGPAAADAVPRLEIAATNDVPRMQRAALAALRSIRGQQESFVPPALAPRPALNSQPAGAPPALFPVESPAGRVKVSIPEPPPVVDDTVPEKPQEPVTAGPTVASPSSIHGAQQAPAKAAAPAVASPVVDSHAMSAPPAPPPAQHSEASTKPVASVKLGPPVAENESNKKTTTVTQTTASEPPKPPAAAGPAEVRSKDALVQPAAPPLPVPGISLNEIGAEDTDPIVKTHQQIEPQQLPTIPARPIERSVGQTKAKNPAAAPPKRATALPLAPLSDDAPLNLESSSGSAKAGSSK